MTTDEKVDLAQKIAEQLVGITPSEWSKWCSYAQREGIKKALDFARSMQNSLSLRREPRQSYRAIAEVMTKFRRQIESLPSQELAELLGYVRRWIFYRRATSREERTR